MPLTTLVSDVLLQFALVHLHHGIVKFRLPSHKVGALVAFEQRGGAAKCEETSQGTGKGACVHGLQGLNMYGSATETGEHKSPALQAGGPSSSPSGLNGPGAKYIETHIGEW